MRDITKHVFVIILLILTVVSMMLFTLCVSADQVTFQPNYNNADDRHLYVHGYNWTTAREMSSATGISGANKYQDLKLYCNESYYTMSRIYLFFNTSSIPDDAVVTSAKLSLYVRDHPWSSSDTFDMYVYVDDTVNPPSNPPVLSDWNYSYYTYKASDKLDLQTRSDNSYNDFVLNQNLSKINKTGFTAFILRSDYDVENVTPSFSGIHVFAFRNTYYAGYEPKLVVTYYTLPVVSGFYPTGNVTVDPSGVDIGFNLSGSDVNISLYWSIDNSTWNKIQDWNMVDSGYYNTSLNEVFYNDTTYYLKLIAYNPAGYSNYTYSFTVTGYTISMHYDVFHSSGSLHYSKGNSYSPDFYDARNYTTTGYRSGNSNYPESCGIYYDSTSGFKFYRLKISYPLTGLDVENISIYGVKVHVYQTSSYSPTPRNWSYMIQSPSYSDYHVYQPTSAWSYSKIIDKAGYDGDYIIYLNETGRENIVPGSSISFWFRVNNDVFMSNHSRKEYGNIQADSSYNYIELFYNYKPDCELVYPLNNSHHVDLTPRCIINVSDEENDPVTVYWYENTSGNWVLQQVNTSCNGNISWVYSNATVLNTTYYWKVMVADTLGNRSYIYHFTTRQLPNKPVNPVPMNHSINYTVHPSFSVTCTDPENDSMNIYFYWGNHTLIGETFLNGNGTATVTPDVKLVYSTNYTWYVNVTTNEGTTTSDIWWFITREDVSPSPPVNVRPYNHSRNNDPSSPIILQAFIPNDPDDDPIFVSFKDDDNNVTILSYSGNGNELLNVSLTPWYLNWSTRMNWSIHIYDGFKWTNRSYWFITNDEPSSVMVFLDSHIKELIALFISLILWVFFIYMVVMGRYRGKIENLLFGFCILGSGLAISASTLLITFTVTGGLISSVIFAMSLYFALKYSLLMFKK